MAAVVSAHPNDMEELAPAMEAVQATGGQMFAQTVADAGYFSAANVQKIAALGTEGCMAAGLDTRRTVNGQKLFGKGQFRYDPATDAFRCPGDQMIKHTGDGQESVGGGETRAMAIYRGRKVVVEPAIGIAKEMMGCRQWSLRGLRKVRGQFALVAMAYDIRNIWQKVRTPGQYTNDHDHPLARS